jgi:hypothetical protein
MAIYQATVLHVLDADGLPLCLSNLSEEEADRACAAKVVAAIDGSLIQGCVSDTMRERMQSARSSMVLGFALDDGCDRCDDCGEVQRQLAEWDIKGDR